MSSFENKPEKIQAIDVGYSMAVVDLMSVMCELQSDPHYDSATMEELLKRLQHIRQIRETMDFQLTNV